MQAAAASAGLAFRGIAASAAREARCEASRRACVGRRALRGTHRHNAFVHKWKNGVGVLWRSPATNERHKHGGETVGGPLPTVATLERLDCSARAHVVPCLISITISDDLKLKGKREGMVCTAVGACAKRQEGVWEVRAGVRCSELVFFSSPLSSFMAKLVVARSLFKDGTFASKHRTCHIS